MPYSRAFLVAEAERIGVSHAARNMGVSLACVGFALRGLSPSEGQADLEPFAPARAGAAAGRVGAERARES